ncbi:MAG: hypothetical protein K2N63_00630 [Lachnospiraceae bacterium]|nr:hypothetical protein [Lachnospiraceae bacterium]
MKKKAGLFTIFTAILAIIIITLIAATNQSSIANDPAQSTTPEPTQPQKPHSATAREKNKDAISISHHYKENGWIIWITASAPDGTPIELPDTTNYTSHALSLDHTTAYLVDNRHDLYMIDKNGFEKIADTVSTADISSTGNILIYHRNDSLYLYNKSEKSSLEIASGLSSHTIYTISPDGRSIAYRAQDGCHRYIDGVEEDEPIKDIYPMAISDNDKYFYYCKADSDEFYVIKDNQVPQKLGLIEDVAYYLNKDCSQMIYGSENKTWFYNKGEMILLANQYFNGLILPETIEKKEWYITVYNPNYDTSVRVLDLNAFGQTLCSLGGSLSESGGLYYLAENMEVIEIAPDYEEVIFSEDGNSVLYSCDGELYRINDLSSYEEPILVEP